MIKEYVAELFPVISLLYKVGVHVFSSGLYSMIQCFSPLGCWLVKRQCTVEVSRSNFIPKWRLTEPV